MSQPQLPFPLSNPIAAGALSIVMVLATLIVPPVIIVIAGLMGFRLLGLLLAVASLFLLVVLALLEAHRAWWCWTSGRHERGFYWALAAMLVAHVAFAFWAIRLCPSIGGLNGASVGFIVVLLFFAGVAFFWRSAASKYLVVACIVTFVFLGILTRQVIEQRELARSNSVRNNLHQVGLAFSDQTSRRLPVGELTAESATAASETSSRDSSLEQRLLRIKEIVRKEFVLNQNRQHTD